MTVGAHDAGFRRRQERYFGAADARHFAWQVGGPGFAPLEAELLRPLAHAFVAPYLEIGCGEGANFVHVGGTGLRVGVDRFVAKLAFAARHVPGVRFVGADAAALPLAAGRFRLVLIRDVLHHVPEPTRVVAEAARVLARGGTLVVIEPNGVNPLVRLHARLVAAEAGLRRSRAAAVEGLVRDASLVPVSLLMAQPLPLRRLVLHPRFGLPMLGRSPALMRALGALESALGGLLGRSRWSYIVLTARRP